MITEEEARRYAELQEMALNAARHGETELLESMLAAGMPVELRDGKGNSLLMLAAYHGQAATVEMLLRHGAEPDARNDRAQTPLAGVAFKGHLEVAEILLAAGADPAADQGGGKTAHMFAAMFGRVEMVKLLESHLARLGKPGHRLWHWLARVTAAFRSKRPVPQSA
jgi:uncharacterized protein